jgi:hypothetical protein
MTWRNVGAVWAVVIVVTIIIVIAMFSTFLH